MTNEKKAFFVEYPRTWEDLTCPHAAERERPYQVVRTVILPTTPDYVLKFTLTD